MTEATLYQPPRLSRSALAVVLLMHGAAITALALSKTNVLANARIPPTIVELLRVKPPPPPEPQPVEPVVRQPQETFIDTTLRETIIPTKTETVSTGPQDHVVDEVEVPVVVAHQETVIAPQTRKVEPARARANLASYVSDSDYPAVAIRGEDQGTTRFRLGVGADGRVTDCAVTASSGSSALDSATCRLMKSRARFSPARNSDGKPVGDSISSAIRWVLPE